MLTLTLTGPAGAMLSAAKYWPVALEYSRVAPLTVTTALVTTEPS
jgi:hypothetical protein